MKRKRFYLILVLLCASFVSAIAQTTVSGTVTDASGATVPGVSIVEKGTTNGTITDIDGKYNLTVGSSAVLQFSFVGMTAIEEVVNGRTTIDVVMASSTTGIDEVVVTALGIKRQSKSVGYITQAISGKDIVISNTPNVVSSMSGKLAGVNITSPNQLDGGSTRIVIRGNNNITGNNQPLFIIDGMPLENNIKVPMGSSTSESTSSVQDYGSGINFINAEDVEEMNVLKGPAASALYGARGANGVVLITTKKGSKKSGIGVDYSYSYKITDPYRFREQQNEYGYGGLAMAQFTADNDKLYETDSQGRMLYPRQRWSGDRYEAIYGQMPSGMWTFDDKAFTWHGYSTSWGRKMDGKEILWWDGEMRPHVPQPDNQQFYYKNGAQSTHNVAFSNAGDFGSVRVGFRRTDNDAVIDNSNFNQTSFNLGAYLNISKVLKAEINANYNDYYRVNGMDMTTNNDYFTKFVYNYPVDYRPELDKQYYKNEDGTKFSTNNNPYGVEGYSVFWKIYEQNTTQQRNQILGSAKLVYSPTDWLSFMTRLGLDYNNQEIETKNTPTDLAGLKGSYSHSLNKEEVTNFDFLATAQKKSFLIDRFDASLSAGATRWNRELYGINGRSGAQFKDPWIYSFANYDLSQQGNQIQAYQVPGEERLQKRINSVYGFLDLSYADYLFLQVTGRNDWSSTLPENNNSYFYPSVSLSFVFSEFLKSQEWLTFGKVRLAYAGAATDADPYQLLPTFSSGSFAGVPTHAIKDVLPPIELMPQRSSSREIGLDLRMFDGRFKFDITYYNTLSENQIMSAPIPVSSGFSSVKFNSGEMQNQGIEIITSYDIIRKKDLTWTLGFNGSRNENKLLSLDGVNKVIEVGSFFGGAGPVLQVEVGEKYGNIYGWDYVYNEKGNKVVVTRKDANGNVFGTLYKTTPTRVKIGNATPDLTGGINSTLRWKRFNLYALVDYSYGGDIWSGDYATSLSSGLSPSTLLERNGGGLPYTYPDGTTANHGILMEGDLEDGTPNTNVVHYTWKYGRLGSWGGGNLSTPSILRNDWVKMREITLTYDVDQKFVQKVKFIQNLSLSFTGRDLFYIYTSLPDKLNPEALSLTAGNAQGLMFGALPGMRSFSFAINVGF
ncbi:MAG TPA: SusC/RagA family TonB-linked outer membrane protein [Draconibacterium sp.]|nr:SusC/RagA family TonB-linked outer membrane protein [Draconibacterium sp.]